mgnify:CR=1 FL=1
MNSIPRFHLAFPVKDLESTRSFYVDLLEYQESGKHFELVLITEQNIYVSGIIELNMEKVIVNILNDRRMGQFRSFESLVKQEIEDEHPKLLREIFLKDIYTLNVAKSASAFNKIPYSTTTLVVIVPLLLLFVKFISTMMIG